MPKVFTNTILLAVFVDDVNNLGELFVKYDTLYIEKGVPLFYPLPKGKVLVLVLITQSVIWTTIRRWLPYKETYYRSIVGQDVDIVIESPPLQNAND